MRMRQLTLPEQIDQAVAAARTTTAEMAAVVMPAITKAEIGHAGGCRRRAGAGGRHDGTGERLVGGVTAGLNAGREQVAQVQQDPRVQQLLAQTTVTAAQVEQVISQAPATAEQISALLARANVTPEQATALLQRAGVPMEQIRQVQQLQAQAGAGREFGQGAAAADCWTSCRSRRSSLTRSWRSFRPRRSSSTASCSSFRWRLRRSGQVDQADRGDAGTVGEVRCRRAGRGRQGRAADRHAGQPGRTPVWRMAVRAAALAGDWLLFALVLLVVTKTLGGRAPLPKHLAAMALAVAPLVLLARPLHP